MSAAFTKLFSSLLDSTLWVEQPAHVKLVWIAMMAMADRDGFVAASIPGLARRAVVTTKEAEEALQVFLSPDPYSRTPDHEGRRIRAVMGGWELLNHAKYRRQASEEVHRERSAESMRRLRAVRSSDAPLIPHSDQQTVTDRNSSASASGSDLNLDPDQEQPPSQPPEPAQGQRSTHHELGDYKPTEADFAAAEMAGLPRERFLVRLEEARNTPIGGRGGVFDRGKHVRNVLVPKWVTWDATDKARAASPRSSGIRVRFPAELNDEPRWSVRHILSEQRAYAEKHELGDVERLGRRFLKERTGPPLLVLEGEREFWAWLRGQRKGKWA